MEAITIQPQTKEQTDAVKAFLKALKIPFKKTKDSPYNPEFVDKIKRSEESIKKGKFHKMTLDEIWK